MHKSDNQGRSKPLVSGFERSNMFIVNEFSNSIVITKSLAVSASGDISRALNVGVALTTYILFPKRRPDPSRSSVPPVPTLRRTFRTIGTVSLVRTSE